MGGRRLQQVEDTVLGGRRALGWCQGGRGRHLQHVEDMVAPLVSALMHHARLLEQVAAQQTQADGVEHAGQRVGCGLAAPGEGRVRGSPL